MQNWRDKCVVDEGKLGVDSTYWKERSVRREDNVDGRASVTKDEERVL